MLWLESTPTTNPASVTTSASLSVACPVPHPKSIIFSPGLGSRSAIIGAVFSAEYTKRAVLLYSDADQISTGLAPIFVADRFDRPSIMPK